MGSKELILYACQHLMSMLTNDEKKDGLSVFKRL
jgi:hypothetical protein